MTPSEIDYRLDVAIERSATILLAFCRLATAFHAAHGRAGLLWLTCEDPMCRANAANLRRWRGEELEQPATAGLR